MNKLHVKTGDTVVILSGKDKGRARFLRFPPRSRRLSLKVNIATKYVKPRQMGQQGGIVKCEAPLYACKVMAVCPHCGKPTRLGHKIEADGSKSRVCKNADCGKSY